MVYRVEVGGLLYKAKITALGCFTPPGVLTNHDLEKIVDTNRIWYHWGACRLVPPTVHR